MARGIYRSSQLGSDGACTAKRVLGPPLRDSPASYARPRRPDPPLGGLGPYYCQGTRAPRPDSASALTPSSPATQTRSGHDGVRHRHQNVRSGQVGTAARDSGKPAGKSETDAVDYSFHMREDTAYRHVREHPEATMVPDGPPERFSSTPERVDAE